MSDETNIKYELYDSTDDTVLLAFVGNGNVDQYPPDYRAIAEKADTGQQFGQDIDGTKYTALMVRSSPFDG